MKIQGFVAVSVAVGLGAFGSWVGGAVPGQVQKDRAAIEFRQKNPGVIVSEQFGRPYKIAAPAMATGATPLDRCARAWCR